MSRERFATKLSSNPPPPLRRLAMHQINAVYLIPTAETVIVLFITLVLAGTVNTLFKRWVLGKHRS
jgi:hypothetical protein